MKKIITYSVKNPYHGFYDEYASIEEAIKDHKHSPLKAYRNERTFIGSYKLTPIMVPTISKIKKAKSKRL